MKLTRSIAFAAAASFAAAANSASANDWVVEPRIQVIETSYMPGRVVVTIDVNAGTCAAGAWLTFLARGATEAERIASTQATLAGLMTAQASSRPVRLYGSNNAA
jgi:hypothetical protein